MFGFGKQELDEGTIAVIALRAGVLVRAEEMDKGHYSSKSIEQWLQFAINESSLKPDAKSVELLRYCTTAIAGDVTGFTEEIFHRTQVKKDKTITHADVQRVWQLTTDGLKASSNASKHV